MPIPQTNDMPSRMSIKDMIYQTLRSWIIDGTLQPNESVNDMEIARYFSTSRTPVREALLLLAQQGLVEVKPSQGTRIAPLAKDSAFMIYEALAKLFGVAAKMACQKRTEEDLEQLHALNDAFAQAITNGEWARFLQCDADFHAAVFQIAGNQYLGDYAQQLTVHAQRYENYFLKNGSDKNSSVQDHEAVIRAIEDQDIEAAQQYAEKNWLGFYRDRLEKLL